MLGEVPQRCLEQRFIAAIGCRIAIVVGCTRADLPRGISRNEFGRDDRGYRRQSAKGAGVETSGFVGSVVVRARRLLFEDSSRGFNLVLAIGAFSRS